MAGSRREMEEFGERITLQQAIRWGREDAAARRQAAAFERLALLHEGLYQLGRNPVERYFEDRTLLQLGMVKRIVRQIMGSPDRMGVSEMKYNLNLESWVYLGESQDLILVFDYGRLVAIDLH